MRLLSPGTFSRDDRRRQGSGSFRRSLWSMRSGLFIPDVSSLMISLLFCDEVNASEPVTQADAVHAVARVGIDGRVLVERVTAVFHLHHAEVGIKTVCELVVRQE